MTRDLTPRQQHFLTYLQRYLRHSDTLPSLRQAASDLNVSHAAVAQLVKTLETKGYVKRKGRYSRTLYLLNRSDETVAIQRQRTIPVVGRVTAGLPMYAQQEWDGSLVLDKNVFPGQNLFALRIRGDSMQGAGILDGDLAICEPRQFARNKEIVVALINGEEATVKRFFLHQDHILLQPENPAYPPMRYDFSQVLIQGKVIGIQRGPEGIN
jgi:repressor LexA